MDATTFSPQYFAEIADLEARHPWSRSMRALTLTLIDREAPHDLHNVLDVGCGAGLFLHQWLARDSAKRAALGVGVDLYADALGWARTRARGAWVRASAGDLPFLPGSFQVIHSADVLQHLSFADSARALDLFASLLAPGGIVALRVRGLRILRNEPDTDFAHAFSRRRLHAELHQRGFIVRFLSHVNALPSLWAEVSARLGRTRRDGSVKGIRQASAAGVSSRLLAAYFALERAWLLASRVPLPFGHTVICIAKKPA